MNTVVLGPVDSLHNGLHGALENAPPPGYRYARRSGRRALLLPDRQATDPFGQLCFGEFAHLGDDSHDVVHSAFWPVLGSKGWVVDGSDFIFPTFGGDFLFSTAFRSESAARATRPAQISQRMAARAAVMLGAYAHDSCKALLLYTSQQFDDMRRWLPTYAGANAQPILDKCFLHYPAVPAISAQAFSQKWSALSPLRVVFCGRHYRVKGGPLALQAFKHAGTQRRDVEFNYIGPLPDEVVASATRDIPRFRHFPRLPREEVLEIFGSAHVLLHLAQHEAVGAAIVEALAAGMAVFGVSDGSEHLLDWCGDRGARLLDRSQVPADALNEAVATAFLTFLDERATVRELGAANYEASVSGARSVVSRDALLTGLYDQARRSTSGPLAVEDLRADAEVRYFDAEALSYSRRDFYRSAQLAGESITVRVEV